MGKSCLVPVALACSSELEHSLCRNCRLVLCSSFLAFGKFPAVTLEQRDSRPISVPVSQLTGDSLVVQRQVGQSQELPGGSPGSQAVLQPGLPAGEQAVPPCQAWHSPSSWLGWQQGRRACPTATREMVPKKEQLGGSSLGSVTLATCQW